LGKVGRLSRILGRGSWVFAAKLIVSLVAIVFAATISVTSSTHQAEIGSALSVTNGLVAMDKGFSVIPSGSLAVGTNCPGIPVLFGALPGTANTTIVAGHLVYAVQINDTSAPTLTTFNVTLVLGSTTYGPLCIRTVLAGAGQIIVCRFDVGTALPASPYTFKVTVQ
jgi:hypothetical protein